jgi:transposase
MIRAPTPQEEDCRRICRARKTLTGERIDHVNRIKGLLFAQRVTHRTPRRSRHSKNPLLVWGKSRPRMQAASR